MSVVKWFAVLVVLNIVDAAATWFVLSNEIAYEYNPIIRWAFEYQPLSLLGLFLVKTLLLGLFGFWVANNDKPKLTKITIMYGALTLYQIVYIAAHLWN